MKSLPRSLFNVNVTDSDFKEINQHYYRILEHRKEKLTEAIGLMPDCIKAICGLLSKHNVTDVVAFRKLIKVEDEVYNEQDFLMSKKYEGNNFDNKLFPVSFDFVLHPNLLAGFHSDVKITTNYQYDCDYSSLKIPFNKGVNIISMENGTIVTTHYDEMTMCIYDQIQQYQQLLRFEYYTFDASLTQMLLGLCADHFE